MTGPLDALTFRPATADDAPVLAAVGVEGFATYSAFAPPGWRVHTLADGLAYATRFLATPSAWCELGEDADGVAGFAAFNAARHARIVDDDPGLAHLWQLMVRPPWWGSGLAARLHGSALAAAAAGGFERMRLFAAAGQARARRFYEREGWTQRDEPFHDEAFGMAVVEYRRAL